MLAYGNNGFRSAFGNHRGEDIFLVISLSIRGELCHLHLQLPQFTQFLFIFLPISFTDSNGTDQATPRLFVTIPFTMVVT